MKIKIYMLIMALLCIVAILMPNHVLASEASGNISSSVTLVKEVANLAELQTALEDENVKEVKLTDIIKIEESVTINGNNKTITTAKAKAFELHTGTVELKNMTIVNSATSARCVDVRDGDVALTLDNVNLKTTSKSHNQPLTIGASFTQVAPINLKNTTIESGPDGWGYAIIIFNPVNLNIQNSNISGYTALYMKSEKEGGTGTTGSNITVNSSTLSSKYELAVNEPSNSFATIVFNDSGINVDINNSKLYAKGPLQEVIGEHSGMTITEKHNKVTISGNSVISTQNVIAGMKDPDAKVILNKGVKSNIEIPSKLLPSGMVAKKENGVYVVSELKVDFVVSQGKVESDKNVVVETLNSSLKADADLFPKAEEAVRNGEDVGIEIKVEELKQETIKEEEKQKMLEVVSKNGKVHQYFDISVLVTANQKELGKLTKLTEKIKLSMKLPKDLAKDGRKFYILKLHDGKVEKIEAILNGENLEFETNEFSLYALAYEDAPVVAEKDDTPKTGSINLSSYAWLALASIAFVGIITTKKSSKHSK